MSLRPEEFQFVEDPRRFEIAGALQVRIGRRILRKRQLLNACARELKFPDHFGHNWDAFEECLCDLSWLADRAQVVLLHDTLPLPHSPRSRRIYLEILAEAVRRHATGDPPELVVVFPESIRAQVLLSLPEE